MIKGLKICGVSDSKTLNYILNHNKKPTMIGFITNYEKSRRFVEYENLKKLVLQQAKLATKAKLDAIVCSAQEAKIVKKVFKKEIITPGIRFSSRINDQKRTLTPKQAYREGADWLVIGRDITKGNIKKNVQTLIDHLNQWLKV